MWPFTKPKPINQLGDVLLPEPTDPAWTEHKTTIDYAGTVNGNVTTTKRECWTLVIGKVRVYRIDEWAPAGFLRPLIYVDGYSIHHVASDEAFRRYMDAVWQAYFARQAARPTAARMRAGCPKVGNSVEIAGWPVGSVIAALTVAEAKKFITELEDATTLAALDPEARKAALSLGAKGGG